MIDEPSPCPDRDFAYALVIRHDKLLNDTIAHIRQTYTGAARARLRILGWVTSSWQTWQAVWIIRSQSGKARMTEQITVSVDSKVANAYRVASDSERRKLDLLVNLRLREATGTRRSLQEVMEELSRNARQRGLTPEILRSILDEE